jgi:adenylate kinase family enzyme
MEASGPMAKRCPLRTLGAIMERVVILGCAGTGKSTLARRLGAKTGLPVVHLDALFWEPGWQESDPAVFRQRVTEALAGGR